MLSAVFFSAIAGSFFNMLVYRLNNGVSLRKPAHSICPQCRERLHWFELIPLISFLFLRGKCSSCGEKISVHYFALEAVFVLTAVVLALFFNGVELWQNLILFWFIWAIFFSDILYQEIPYTFSIGFGVLLLWQGLSGSLFNLLIWLILFLFIKSIEKFYYKKSVFGGADLLFLFMLAVYFNLAGYVLLLYAAFFSGLFISLGLLALRKAGRESLIPFMPFILLGFVLVQYAGSFIIQHLGKFYGF